VVCLFVLVVDSNNVFFSYFCFGFVLWEVLGYVCSLIFLGIGFCFWKFFCLILCVYVFFVSFGFWVFFSLLFGSIENTLPLIVIVFRRDSI
jgi:hypothetical protein